MKFTLYILTLLLFGPPTLSEETVELNVLIQGLDVHEGKVAIELMNPNEERVREYWLFVDSDKVEFVVPELVIGDYAMRFFHDENNNGVMDKNWLGIPTEAFGFSNDAKLSLGPPDIEDMIFTVEGRMDIVINARRL